MSGFRTGRRREKHLIAPPVGQLRPDAAPAELARAVGELRDKVAEVLPAERVAIDVELVTGSNTFAHGLSRAPRFVLVTPKTASAAFAPGWDPAQPGNPRPDALVTITVVGGPMQARIEVR